MSVPLTASLTPSVRSAHTEQLGEIKERIFALDRETGDLDSLLSELREERKRLMEERLSSFADLQALRQDTAEVCVWCVWVGGCGLVGVGEHMGRGGRCEKEGGERLGRENGVGGGRRSRVAKR